MSPAAAARRVVLLDIEGTTTPIAFVHDTLFAHARAHLRSFLEQQQALPEIAGALARLASEHAGDRGRPGVPDWPAGAITSTRHAAAYAEWLMDRDRKSPALKLLQGLIWLEGYRAGDLHGQVYDDVPVALRAWRQQGVDVAIYSSGSELAQRLLFASTIHGDLTTLISGFFDTGVGAKADPSSYRNVADQLGCLTADIIFVSDVTRELGAAREAGCTAILSIRPGNPPQPHANEYTHVTTLLDL